MIFAARWGRLDIIKFFVSLGATNFKIAINEAKHSLQSLAWGERGYLEDLQFNIEV